MAKIISPVWSSIRGSIGGTTYFPNQYGSIIARARVTPVNPATTFQGLARDAVSEATENWKNIAESFRAGWRWYGQNTIMQGPQGNYTLPGREQYIRSYSAYEYLLSRGFTTPAWVANAPSTLGLPEIGPVTVTDLAAPGVGFGLNFTNWNAESVSFYASIAGPFGETRRRYKGPFQSDTLDFHFNVATAASGLLEFTGLIDEAIYFWQARIIGATGSGTRLSVKTLGRTFARETVI